MTSNVMICPKEQSDELNMHPYNDLFCEAEHLACIHNYMRISTPPRGQRNGLYHRQSDIRATYPRQITM